MKSILNCLALLLLCAVGSVHADAEWKDYGRIDLPMRDQTLFFHACFSIYLPSQYVGLNCYESTIGPLEPPIDGETHTEQVVVTAFDMDHTWLVDEPCVLQGITHLDTSDDAVAYHLTCYESDEIFRDNFEGAAP